MIWPDASAAAANRSAVLRSKTDDTTVGFDASDSAATDVGRVVDAEASSHYLVDTRLS